MPDQSFPPVPRGLKGRRAELDTLARSIARRAPTRWALVGPGGSGKSLLAAALGRRLSARFAGRIHWFRVGAWDFQTLVEMLALAFGTPRTRPGLVAGVRRFLKRDERLIVFDNHEDDLAMSRLLAAFSGTPTSVIITARRCLLSGLLIHPVAAPLQSSGRVAFPRVAALTRLLRWNPLALDVADAVVASGAASLAELTEFLIAAGIERVRVIDHEDDLPEVALLVDWAWRRLSAPSRRMLAVLAHLEGDHADLESLALLAGVRGAAARGLAQLVRWHLVQQPMPGRYALHAVVRYAVARRTHADPARVFEHYVSLLERQPERLRFEQTHLFFAMDHAQRCSDLDAILRVDRLLERLTSHAR